MISLEFWHAMGGNLGELVDELTQRFNDSQDRVVVVSTYQGSYDDTYNALLEHNLVDQRGWVEFSVYPLFSPQSLIAEGSANYGIELAFPGAERIDYERDHLFPLAGLDPEQADRYWREAPGDMQLGHVTNAVARSAVNCSRMVEEVRAIVTYTGSGGIARLVSDYRPRVPILALTPNPATFQSLALYWGVQPVLFTPSSGGGESIFADIEHCLLRRGLVERGEQIALTLGWPLKAHTSTNLLKMHTVGEALRSGK